MAVVKRATGDDWRDLRMVRLAALADSPSAFGSSLEAEQSFDEADWRAWSRSAAVFIASEGGTPVGMVAAFDEEIAGERRLVALWVHPDHRGTGVASSLVTAVEDWAREEGADRLTLWVAAGNEAARGLYERHGFVGSGSRKPLPSNPAIDEEQMLLPLR